MRQVLAGAEGRVEADTAEQAEIRFGVTKSMWFTKRWRKWRDAPLADVVVYKLRRRARLGMADPADTEARVARVRRTSR